MNVKVTRICTDSTVTSKKVATRDGKLVCVRLSIIHR